MRADIELDATFPTVAADRDGQAITLACGPAGARVYITFPTVAAAAAFSTYLGQGVQEVLGVDDDAPD